MMPQIQEHHLFYEPNAGLEPATYSLRMKIKILVTSLSINVLQ